MKLRLLTFSIFFITGPASAQKNADVVSNKGIARPKVVIGIVVDQMRWDYLYRYYRNYSDIGFKRLLNMGFSFENTFIPYTPAVTASGHTSIYTGSVPAIHGIVGNEWLENDGAYMYCTGDHNVKSTGGSRQGSMSPNNMLVTTIGDELRLATNFNSRVYGIALKDRGGIVAAGRGANAAYWFDDSTGNWISSSWYLDKLPPWVISFNRLRKSDSLLARQWTLMNEKGMYDQSTDDDVPYERTLLRNSGRSFPYDYKMVEGGNYYNVRLSPFANTYTFDFAKDLIKHEGIGRRSYTDMLCISLSATDYIGHRSGPNSQEVQDTYVRLDKDIASFLTHLDQEFGTGNYLLFLSADHGAPQSPAFLKEKKISAGHLNAYVGLRDTLNRIGFEKFGINNMVKKIFEYQVYLDPQKIINAGLDEMVVRKYLTDHLLQRPEVLTAFDYKDFHKLIFPVKYKEMLANGYNYSRSGDIQFIFKPGYTDGSATGTDHGTLYTYDTHIPLIWYGWKIRHGSTNREVYITDIAPTIAALLKIQMPNGCVGKVLEEVMR